jgi:hypothetical protein
MVTYNINGKKIQLDETKEYFDFYIEQDLPVIAKIQFAELLKSIESGDFKIDSDFEEYLMYLLRWVVEAPRKRGYRNMRREGEYFFETDGGDVIIDNLENTGKFVEYLLKELFNKTLIS